MWEVVAVAVALAEAVAVPPVGVARGVAEALGVAEGWTSHQ